MLGLLIYNFLWNFFYPLLRWTVPLVPMDGIPLGLLTWKH